MRKSAWITAATAAVVVAGGVGAYALTSQDEPAPAETVAVETTAPTVEPTAEPTPTTEPTPVETATPVPTPVVTYTDAQAELIYVTNAGSLADLGLTDEEIITAGESVCATDSGTEGVQHIPNASEMDNRQFAANARYALGC